MTGEVMSATVHRALAPDLDARSLYAQVNDWLPHGPRVTGPAGVGPPAGETRKPPLLISSSGVTLVASADPSFFTVRTTSDEDPT